MDPLIMFLYLYTLHALIIKISQNIFLKIVYNLLHLLKDHVECWFIILFYKVHIQIQGK